MNTTARHSPSLLKSALNVLAAIAFLLLAGRLAAADPAPASGVAQGTFAPKGETPAKLTNAAALVDVKDDDKPTIVILSDRKLPTEKWTSEFDLMEAKGDFPFSGFVFWIDKDGNVFRTDFYWKGKQASASGVFEVKLDSAKGAKEITGTAKTTSKDADDPQLDVKFHATLK